MDQKPCLPKASIIDSSSHADLLESYRQLEAELLERKLVEAELRQLTIALELGLKQSRKELAEVKDQLSREQRSRSGQQEQVAHPDRSTDQQTNALKVLADELESLTYCISHDLRAPLRHVIGFSNVLMEDYRDDLDATAQNYLECLARAGRKMDSQVEALLKLSRINRQALIPTRIDLSKIAREHAASLKGAAPERSVIFSIEDNLAVCADEALLKAAITNLLDNAWKFTENEETATIEFGRKPDTDPGIFYLRDNGAGFDMRYAGRLFGPFQRMHRDDEFEGMGMGLAFVQRIIHRHSGKIWADAAVDGGATFFFTLSEE